MQAPLGPLADAVGRRQRRDVQQHAGGSVV